MTTKKKPVVLHKNIPAPPRSPNNLHPPSSRKVLSKSKSKPQKGSKPKQHPKKTKQKGGKQVHTSRVKVVMQHLSPPAKSQKKLLSKSSKSVKKSHGYQSIQASKSHKNIYTHFQQDSQSDFWRFLSQKSFQKLSKFKFDLLSYIFKERIVRDSQIDELYQQLVQRFPEREPQIKKLLMQIVSSLDS